MKKENKTTVESKLYSSIAAAISDVIRGELATSTTTPLRELKPNKLKSTTVKNLKLANSELHETQGIIVKQIDLVRDFLEVHSSYELTKTETFTQPTLEPRKNKIVWTNEASYKGLDKFFTQIEKTITPHSKAVYRGYTISDRQGLIEAIKNDENLKVTHYSIKDPNANDLTAYVSPVFIECGKLAERLGIPQAGGLYARIEKRIGDADGNTNVYYGSEYTPPKPDCITTDIRQSDLNLYHVLVFALVRQQELLAKNNKREIVNIKDASKHDVVMLPTSLSLTDLIDGAFEGRDINELYNDYRKNGYGSNGAIKSSGGWLAHIDRQTELPFDFGEKDKKTLIKFMTNTKALVIDVVTALGRYLRDHPQHDDNDYISLIDLARYIEKYNDSKLKKGELRPNYRQQILNGLQLAQLISADYVVSKDKKGGKEWRKIYILDRITDYKTYGNTNTVTAVKVNFTKAYRDSFALNLGVIYDGVLQLDGVEYKALAAYIAERFAQFQDDTIKGEPQTITVSTLIKKAGIVNTNKTENCDIIQRALDTLTSPKIDILSKWECKNKTKRISTLIKDSQTLLLYPSKNLQKSYVNENQTAADRKALKLEQENRCKALKQWFRQCKFISLDMAARELDISTAELSRLLAGKGDINDDILETIQNDKTPQLV